MRAGPLVLIFSCLLPAPLLAQEPAPSPTPTPSPVVSPSADAAKPAEVPEAARQGGKGDGGGKGGGARRGQGKAAEDADPDPIAPGEIRIRAETQGMQQGHYEARGFVDLRSDQFRIQADKIDLFQEQKEGEAENRRLVAEGNVVFMRGDERLSGTRLELDVDKQTGLFENALGYVTPGVFVEGKRIQKVDADTYKIEGGRFTSCAQPTPRWSFSASNATLHIDDKITATNVIFRVKSMPAMYLPYFQYPIDDDQRSTGFLFPHFGYSSFRGYNVGSGFFWAMGRTADQTFYVDRYSRYGWGFGHELRYLREVPSRGNFRTYVFRPQAATDTLDYDLDWTAAQSLPADFKLNVNVRYYSNTTFNQQIQEDIERATRRTRTGSVNLQRSIGATNIQLLADTLDTFFGETRLVNRHLPTLRVARSPKKIGRSGLVVGFEGRAETLAIGDETLVDRYSRFDLWPRVSRPLSSSFIQLTPEVQYRYTRYGARRDEENALVEPGIDRRYLEANVDLRGPNFSRVFETPGNFYSEKYKHVFGPEVVWTYRRTGVDDFTAIPIFDGIDRQVGTHQVEYALVNRFYAKRPSGARGNRLDAYEFLNWRVGQTYYLNVKEDASVYDPNYTTEGFGRGPDGEPTRTSPLSSRLRFKPTRALTGDFTLEYDVNYKAVRSLSLAAGYETPAFGLSAGWNRASRLAPSIEPTPVRNTLRASTHVQLLPNRLKVQGSTDYDVLEKKLLQVSGQLRYDVQCCGFVVEAARRDFNLTQETRFTWGIELANIGMIGNFNGEEVANERRRLGGGFR